jgi:hypothetical protein
MERHLCVDCVAIASYHQESRHLSVNLFATHRLCVVYCMKQLFDINIVIRVIFRSKNWIFNM